MSGYFIVEIFPKAGHSFTPIKGDIEFNYQNRECVLIARGPSIDLEITTGSKSAHTACQYNTVSLYLYAEDRDIYQENLFVDVERICDILSLATGNHIAYFSSTIDEYSYFSGWGFSKDISFPTVSGSLTHRDSNSDFLSNNLLNKINQKVSDSPYKERILASIHMNRLAKYKSFSHITEAITDCVNCVEALYMQEKGTYQSYADLNIIPKCLKNNKTEIFEYFLATYYSGSKNDLAIVNIIKPYKIRSAYLHRGKLLEPVSKNTSAYTKDLTKAEEFHRYNLFYKIVFFTILNFIKNYA